MPGSLVQKTPPFSLLVCALLCVTPSLAGAQDTSLPPKEVAVSPGFEAPQHEAAAPGFEAFSKDKSSTAVGTRTSLISQTVHAASLDLADPKARQEIRKLHGLSLDPDSGIIALGGRFALKGKEKPQLAVYDPEKKTLSVYAGSERVAMLKNYTLLEAKHARALGAPSPLFAVQLVEDGLMELVALSGSAKAPTLKLHKVFDNYVGDSLKVSLKKTSLTSAVTCIKAPKHFLLQLDLPGKKPRFLMWNPWEGLFRVPTKAPTTFDDSRS